MTEILDYGEDAAGNKVCRGKFVVDPSGHLVLIKKWAVVKPGWRLATQGDIDARKAPLPVPALALAPAPVPVPVPDPVEKSTVMFLGRESLGNDAVTPPSGPRVERQD